MTKPIELRKRVLVVQSVEDREVAWVRPFAVVNKKYYHELPEGTYGDFGTSYLGLVAIKGDELTAGDAFETYNPNITRKNGLPKGPLVGNYLPNIERL